MTAHRIQQFVLAALAAAVPAAAAPESPPPAAPAAAAPPAAATFENRHAVLAIDAHGRVVSLRSKATGRELLARPQALVSARLKDGRTVAAREAAPAGGALAFGLEGVAGTVVLAVDARDDFFTLTVRSVDVPGVDELTFFTLPAAPAKYVGSMANMLSDDADAVCLRGYDLEVGMAVGGNPAELRVSTTAEHGLAGWRAGLAAGPKAGMAAMLRAMAAEAGVPLSHQGGPWSLGAEANRGSYLFADLSLAAVDDWIEVARRGGFTHIHLHGWWDTLGHYGINRSLFPNGLADMQAAVARIHAAGLKAGLHTLTACIDPRDAWVTPEASPHLIAAASYTLARPLAAGDAVIEVNERPVPGHDVVFTYAGNGNAIRIGGEIIQYQEVRPEPPFGFAGCRRGAFGTRPADHPAGARADYLQQRYLAFYPVAGSPLAGELADCIARVFNDCRMDQIYFDGSEGMMSRHGIDFMRRAIFGRLRGEVLAEASEWGAHSWWFHSRLGAWDHPVWAAKRFHDLHVASVARFRDSDLLEPQLGWWAPRQPSAQARGHFLDEMEYFGAKNLGLDAAMSVQGVNVSQQPLGFHVEKQFTVLGWHERLRLARYFDAATVARVAVPGDEFRLRQDPGGEWRFTPVSMAAHRIDAVGNGSERWTSRNPFAAQPAAARIEALWSVAPDDDPGRACVTDFPDLAAFQQETSSGAVELHLEEAAGEPRGGGRNLLLRARNQGAARRGAWARAGLRFPAPYRDLSGAGALGLWVKGDGKGALLNIQLGTPREYMQALSDHHVTLDFTGWRHVGLLLRERDVERMAGHVWPYGGHYDIYRNPLDMAHVSALDLYLNNLPAGDTTEVVLGPVMALPVVPAELANPVLEVNGRRLALPVTLTSGDFLEVQPDGGCAHHDAAGELLGEVRPDAAQGWPVLQPGDNPVAFACEGPERVSARAEVTLVAAGEPFGAPAAPDRIGWDHLAREYEMPRWVTAPGGAANEWVVPVRPGRRARLEIELGGGMEAPALTVNGTTLAFPVTLGPGQRLVCRDQRRWVVLDAGRAQVAAGELAVAPPLLHGGPNRISFTCGAPARAIVRLVKAYEP